jgi:myo-inositol-1(or 4)-monophosphatase
MEFLKEYELATNLLLDVGANLKLELTKEVESSIGKDIKLVLDKSTELLIIKGISKFSKFKILSEETGFNKLIETNEIYWILDPIDGSMNFARGFKYYSISLALYVGITPIFGIIYNFETEELFKGYVGIGAYYNNRKLSTPIPKSVDQSILATGFPVFLDLNDSFFLEFQELVKKYKKIRMIGCASLSIALVATGVFDSYFEKEIKFWDVAAGVAIIVSLEIPMKNFEIKNNYLINIHI